MQITALYPYGFAGRYRVFDPKEAAAPASGNPDIEITVTIRRRVDATVEVRRRLEFESEAT